MKSMYSGSQACSHAAHSVGPAQQLSDASKLTASAKRTYDLALLHDKHSGVAKGAKGGGALVASAAAEAAPMVKHDDLPQLLEIMRAPGGAEVPPALQARVSERISYSRNVYRGVYNGSNSSIRDGSYPHEAFTSDGNGGAYAGPISAASASGVTVPKAVDISYVGAALAVIAGAGAGQPRRGRGAGGTGLSKNHRFIKENKVQILGFCCIPGPTCDFEIEGDPTVG